jgi:hypothetical protein
MFIDINIPLRLYRGAGDEPNLLKAFQDERGYEPYSCPRGQEYGERFSAGRGAYRTNG